MAKFNKLKAGEILSESQHYRLLRVHGSMAILKPDSGEPIEVDREYVETFLTSGEQETTKETISKTDAAALFVSNPYVAMTVNFNKMVKPADVEKQIMDAYESNTPSEFKAAVKETIKHGLTGEERTMVGYHYGKLDDLGRVQFIDMKLERNPRLNYDDRLRLVDPRTINYIILRDVKYIVK